MSNKHEREEMEKRMVRRDELIHIEEQKIKDRIEGIIINSGLSKMLQSIEVHLATQAIIKMDWCSCHLADLLARELNDRGSGCIFQGKEGIIIQIQLPDLTQEQKRRLEDY